MNRPSNRVWASLALLSIIAPVGLLATFRLTDLLREPPKPETITVETVVWNMSRPTYFLSLEEKITNAYVGNVFSSSFTVCPTSYWENDGTLDYNDGLWFRLTATSNISSGFIYSMNLRSSQTDDHAVLYFHESIQGWTELNNLEQKKVVDGSQTREALFETMGVSQPKECTLKMKPLWIFFDPNDLDHWITIVLEVVYSDGTMYRQIDIPLRLGVMAFKESS